MEGRRLLPGLDREALFNTKPQIMEKVFTNAYSSKIKPVK